jgi:hypothetical protein
MKLDRFDQVARAFASVKVPRRGVFGLLLGAGSIGAAWRMLSAQPYCISEGGTCTLFVRCCEGFICSVGYMAPNVGVCTKGSAQNGLWFAFPGMLTPRPTATVRPTRRAGRNKRKNKRNRRRSSASSPTRTPAPTATPTPVPTATPPLSNLGVEVAIVLVCDETPEISRVRNTGTEKFTLESMMSSSGQSLTGLGVAIAPNGWFTVRTEAAGTSGQSSITFYPEPSIGAYADFTIRFAERIETHRGYCDGRASSLVP